MTRSIDTYSGSDTDSDNFIIDEDENECLSENEVEAMSLTQPAHPSKNLELSSTLLQLKKHLTITIASLQDLLETLCQLQKENTLTQS